MARRQLQGAAKYLGSEIIRLRADGALQAALDANSLIMALPKLYRSIMARRSVKKMWARIIPEPIRRSSYVLFSNAGIIVLLWQVQPLLTAVSNIDIRPMVTEVEADNVDSVPNTEARPLLMA